MSESIVENNSKKEFIFALGGVALFLGIVLVIGVSAFLRPAGEHITAASTDTSIAATADETVDQATVTNTDVTAEQADGDLEGADEATATQ